MNRRTVFIALTLISTLAAGQELATQSSYPTPGISATIPTTSAIQPVLTSPVAELPSAPSVNPMPITAPLTRIPTIQAVPPPIEPSPTERAAAALRSTYTSAVAAAPAPREHPYFDRGVNSEGVPMFDDDTHGRSLGEIARENRQRKQEAQDGLLKDSPAPAKTANETPALDTDKPGKEFR